MTTVVAPVRYNRLFWLVLLLLGVACHPVRQVLRDPKKFEAVASEVVRRGYCVNDTVTVDTLRQIITRDSLIRDTLLWPAQLTAPTEPVDTVLASGARLAIDTKGRITVSCPVNVEQQVVTVRQLVRDRKKEQLLQQDIDQRDLLLDQRHEVYQQLQAHYDQQQQQLSALQAKLRKRTLYLYGLLLLVALYIGFKTFKQLRSFLPL